MSLFFTNKEHARLKALPAQRGEGLPGSGFLMRWTEAAPATTRTIVHGLCFDDHAAILGWNITGERDTFTLDGPDQREKWTLRTAADGTTLAIEESISGQACKVACNPAGNWSLRSK